MRPHVQPGDADRQHYHDDDGQFDELLQTDAADTLVKMTGRLTLAMLTVALDAMTTAASMTGWGQL